MMRKLLALALFVVASAPQDPKPVDVIVDAPSAFAPGSMAGVRVAVVQSKSLTQTDPVEGATVTVTLARQMVFSGRTDGRGTAAISFRVPDLAEGTHPLKIEVGSAAGPASFEQLISVRSEQKILLVTDKPIYQPGQTIHVRALALADWTLDAVKDSELLFEIDDAKGNKVFKRSARTSRFGVASIDFTLADEVNVGDFKIAAHVGKAKSEKTVTVKKYVLPKFKVELKTEKNWYEPLALVKGTIQADYFFGKPVEGEVTIKASNFDAAFREFARVKAKVDANGRAEFEFRLPGYFVGIPLEKGNALLQLEAEVADKADHSEKVSRSLVVSPQPLRMNAIAESGKLAPGVENLLYVVVTTPDGSPVETNVTCNGKEARTSAAGFATFPIVPDAKSFRWNNQRQHVMDVELKAQGATAKLEIPVEGTRESILLRLDKAVYEAGQTAKVEAFSTRKSGTVFLDIVKKGQTILTTTTELANGRTVYPLALDPSLFGAVELHAYVIEPNGDIVRDTKVCYVQPPHSLKIAVTTGQPEYRPGAPCTIDFRVTDQDNRGRQAALGVIIVDESVYALQDMQPGLEKIYFTLEKELAQPKIEQCVGRSLTDALQNARQDAAKMLLANVEPPAKRWNVNTLTQRHRQFAAKMQKIYWALHNHVSAERATVTVKDEKTGDREFRKDLLEDLKTKAKYVKLAAEDLVDPWGNAVTLAGLAQLSPTFKIEYWRKLLSWNQMWEAWQTIRQKAAKGEAIPTDFGKDGFGDPLTLDRLAQFDPAFSKENIAKIEASQRLGKPDPTILQPAYTMMIEEENAGFDAGGHVMKGGRLGGGFGGMAPRAPGVVFEAQDKPQTAVEEKRREGRGQGNSGGGEFAPAARVREYFPETLFWNPQVITNEDGTFSIPVMMADSITTWRLTASANTADGLLGSTTHSIRVFQDFFVDIDFPVALTQGDRVSVPVAVFNYLKEEQKVELKVERADWFELREGDTKTVTMKSGEVKAVYFPIRVKGIGAHALTVHARGTRLSDAVRRPVEVVPDGKMVEVVLNDRLEANVNRVLEIPPNAIDGASKILFKAYPGVFASVMDGLEGMLRMPGG